MLSDGAIEQLETRGYCLLEQAIPRNLLDQVRSELARLESSISGRQHGRPAEWVFDDPNRFMLHQLQFEVCPAVHALISSGRGFQAVAAATGDDLVCTGATYAHCKPGYRAIQLHTDHDPYDTQPYRPSNPIALRVLHYLDDLTEERAPLRVVPGSHLRIHRQWRYDQRLDRHEQERTVTCCAGDAVIINTKLFHAVGPNLTRSSRRVVAITYRPDWAAPVRPVAEHEARRLETLSSELLPLFADLNRRGSPAPCR